MKKESPELFRVSPSSDMHDILKMQIQQTLSNRDEYGSIIYVFRVRKYKFTLDMKHYWVLTAINFYCKFFRKL